MNNFTVNNPEICHRNKCVYQLECQNCQAKYIGCTIRPLHQRIKEHLKNEISSVFKHKQSCKADFNPTIITTDNDVTTLHYKEALLIKTIKPTINAREELNGLDYLLL